MGAHGINSKIRHKRILIVFEDAISTYYSGYTKKICKNMKK